MYRGRRAIRDRSPQRKAFDTFRSPLPMMPLAYDPPAHTRNRKIMRPFFSYPFVLAVLDTVTSAAICAVTGAGSLCGPVITATR